MIKESTKYIYNEEQHDEDYIVATYYFETSADPWAASIGIAKEQSASSWIFMRSNQKKHLDKFLAKVVSVDTIGFSNHDVLSPYKLKTYSYTGTSKLGKKSQKIVARIAYPIRNFESSFTTMLNTVVGEVHRLGYLSAIKLLDLDFPQSYLLRFNGPKYGITGIRNLLNIPKRPIFCRSTQPPMGLKVEDMEKITFSVLNGGFDIIKDDELTYAIKEAGFKKRVSSLAKVTRKVEEETGEKKLYFVNVIDDYDRVIKLSKLAIESGADGVVVSPILCGFSTLMNISERFEVPIFSHHSLMDVFTRHTAFGIDYSLIMKLQRMCSADFIVTPGSCCTTTLSTESTKKIVDTCLGKLGSMKEAFPVLAGGKQASELLEYVRRMGTTDFMLLVANAVDNHPMGLEAGARAFRQSWCAIEEDIPIKDYALSHRELEEAMKSDIQK